MGADIENPDDGGDYVAAAAKEDAVAAAAKEDAGAVKIKRYPTDEEFCWSMAFVYCYLVAMVLYVEYEGVKFNPAGITYVVRLDLCMLLLVFFLFVLMCLVTRYCFGIDLFKKKEEA